MSEPVVIFGGPSPEHDVSILTGLQAARALGDAGTAVSALYWSKAGDWYEVDATLEGEAFLEGVPRGAKPVRLITGKGGGFVAGGKGLVGRERALEVSAAVNCCHGGPGEDGTLQGVLDLAGVPYTGPTLAGAALGMDKLAFAAVVIASGLPSLPRRGLTAEGAVDFCTVSFVSCCAVMASGTATLSSAACPCAVVVAPLPADAIVGVPSARAQTTAVEATQPHKRTVRSFNMCLSPGF